MNHRLRHSVRPPGRVRRRDEQGVILMYVLGATLMLSIIGMALLAFASVSIQAASAHTKVADRLRTIDGALEIGARRIRNDEAHAMRPDCSAIPPFTVDGLWVRCSDVGAPVDPSLVVAGEPYADVRIVDLVATGENPSLNPGARPLGAARVVIHDMVNEVKFFGYSLEVCDWRLGSREAAEPLKGCG